VGFLFCINYSYIPAVAAALVAADALDAADTDELDDEVVAVPLLPPQAVSINSALANITSRMFFIILPLVHYCFWQTPVAGAYAPVSARSTRSVLLEFAGKILNVSVLPLTESVSVYTPVTGPETSEKVPVPLDTAVVDVFVLKLLDV
jgi:hypothetical protein